MPGQDDRYQPGSLEYWRTMLDEAGSEFEPAPSQLPPLQTLRDLHSQVLRAYGYACAMTGQQISTGSLGSLDQLDVVPIKPLAFGGVLHVDNMLCLTAEASLAFHQGAVSIGPDLQLIVDLSVIDPELLERLNALGRLALPDPELATLDASSLSFHRENIFLQRNR